MREHSCRLSKEVGSAKSPASLPIFSRLPSSAPLRRGLRIRNCFRQTGAAAQGKANVRRTAEPSFMVLRLSDADREQLQARREQLVGAASGDCDAPQRRCVAVAAAAACGCAAGAAWAVAGLGAVMARK